ncbi:MAG: hypothetical protein ACXABV_12730 [Candidatus Thorarchaeota archaeon]|jgi:hypothetical protein
MALKEEARGFLKQSNTSLKKAISHSEKYIPYVEEFHPECLDEIRGYADCSKVIRRGFL